MATDLTHAVDALTKTSERLAQAVGTQVRGDYSSLKVNLILAIATAATALFTALIVWFTFRAAQKAALSAAASEQMVKIERERQREADRPELYAIYHDVKPVVDEQKEVMSASIKNQGKGPAQDVKAFAIMLYSDGVVSEGSLQAQLPEIIGPGSNPMEIQFLFPFKSITGMGRRDIIITHCTDMHSGPEEERVYHYVHDTQGIPPQQPFRPGQKLPAVYLQACGICRIKTKS